MRLFSYKVFPLFVVIWTAVFSIMALEARTVTGQITKGDAGIPAIPVALLKLNRDAPPGTPPMMPLATTETDAQGQYIFENIEAADNDLFLIGVLFEGRRESSEPFSFGSEPSQTVTVSFPDTPERKVRKLSGRLIQDGSLLPDTPIAILRLLPNPGEGPPVEPVATGRTKTDGTYEFTDVPALDNDVFIIGIRQGEDRRISDRITFDTETDLQFDIILTGTSTDPADFVPARRSLVVNYYLEENMLRFTDFIQYRNVSRKLLDLRKNPVEFDLPADAVNPIYFRVTGNEITNVTFVPEKMLAGVYTDQEVDRFAVEYDISNDVKNGMIIGLPSTAGFEELELIYPLNALTVSAPRQHDPEEQKVIGKVMYGVKKIKLTPDQTSVLLEISNLPIPQTKLAGISAALIFLPVSLTAVLFYLRQRKITKRHTSDEKT